MVKFSSPAGRPVRLSEETRRFAQESLNAVYGKEAERTPYVDVTFEGDADEAYDAAIRAIAERAPLRVSDVELISGAATLGGAIEGYVPAAFDGKPIFAVTDHVTFGFDRALDEGVNAMEKEIDELAANADGKGKRFLKSLKNVAQSMRVWHGRYMAELEKRGSANARYLKRVPFSPPESFREAVQSLWFLFAFTRLTGNWSGIGRIDVMLGKYLKSDLDRGVLTLDEAREILAHFFIKGCEWITGKSNGTGDGQHYQNIVIGGCDEDGNDVTNEVSYLVLDIVEELPIGDFPITVRAGGNKRLIRRAAEVIRHGGGTVAVYGERTVIEAMTKAGYALSQARRFANDGCWEVQVPGETFFIYTPFDGYAIFQKALMSCDDGASYESVYDAFMRGVGDTAESIFRDWTKNAGYVDGKWTRGDCRPCAVASFFTRGCAVKGASYFNGGPVYNVISLHMGGLPDAANGLYALRKAVFDDKLLTVPQLKFQIANDWPDEVMRRTVFNRYKWYGNGDCSPDGADAVAARIVRDFAAVCRRLDGRCPVMFPAGISTFGRQADWAPYRDASAFGLKKGAILSGNFSATPGTDRDGVTALIRSYCTADLSLTASGAALDVSLSPSCVKGDEGTEAIASLIEGFVSQGGFFMQIDVTDAQTLLLAQQNPEAYRNLTVRVSGWNARFVTLNKEWQRMIIERARQCTE